MDGGVAIFDVGSGKLMHTLEGHHKPVRSLTFTPGTASLSVGNNALLTKDDLPSALPVSSEARNGPTLKGDLCHKWQC